MDYEKEWNRLFDLIILRNNEAYGEICDSNFYPYDIAKDSCYMTYSRFKDRMRYIMTNIKNPEDRWNLLKISVEDTIKLGKKLGYCSEANCNHFAFDVYVDIRNGMDERERRASDEG